VTTLVNRVSLWCRLLRLHSWHYYYKSGPLQGLRRRCTRDGCEQDEAAL